MDFRISRRAFIQSQTLFLFAAGNYSLAETAGAADQLKEEPSLTIGLLTDVHFADKPPAGSRYYRESLSKMKEAIGEFEKFKPDFVVELGDLIDAADSVEVELSYLEKINSLFEKSCRERHYVLGNHCVDTLTKEEFLGTVKQEKSFYSFDHNGFHFIILDACFTREGTPYQRKNFEWTDTAIPKEELEWLKADLEKNQRPTIVFAHQRLDTTDAHGVKNSPDVRKVLESSGNVLLVLQGHNHMNDLKEINSIHYCTLAALIEGSGEENNAYSIMNLYADKTISIEGFRKQADRKI